MGMKKTLSSIGRLTKWLGRVRAVAGNNPKEMKQSVLVNLQVIIGTGGEKFTRDIIIPLYL